MEEGKLFDFLVEHTEYRDGALVLRKSWCVRNKSKIGQPLAKIRGEYKFISIYGKWFREHRLIYLLAHGTLPENIDHINRDKLDNRIDNLREACKAENERNRDKYRINTSGYKGVWFHNQRKKWCAEITTNGKSRKLGLFDSKEDAAVAYNEASLKYHGEFAYQNIIVKE